MTSDLCCYRMRIYAGFTLSECACIMSGLGAYPASSKPRPGQGPTKPEELSEEGTYSSINWEVSREKYTEMKIMLRKMYMPSAIINV